MIMIFLRTGKSLQDDGDALNSRDIEGISEGQGQLNRKTENISSDRQITIALALFMAAIVISAVTTISIYSQNIIVATGTIIGAIVVVVMIRKRLG